jgi:hypothetical protein
MRSALSSALARRLAARRKAGVHQLRPGSCDASLLDWSAPENATIELPAASAARPEQGADLIAALQTWQPTALPAL